MTQPTLGQVIEKLKSLPPETVIRNGFDFGASYRGYYNEIAFYPLENATAGEMLKHALKMDGKEMLGYMGGGYLATLETLCWISEYGKTDDEKNPRLTLEAMEEWGRREP